MRKRDFVFVSFAGDVYPRMELQIRSLKNYGFEPIVLVWAGSETNIRIAEIERIQVDSPITKNIDKRLPQVLRSPAKFLEYMFRLIKELRRVAGKGTTIQISNPFLLPMTPFVHKKGMKICYDAYEYFDAMYGEAGFFGNFLGKLSKIAENRFIPYVDGVLCVTSKAGWLKRRLMKLNSNTLELWNLPQLDQRVNNELLREVKQEFVGKEIVAYVGGLHDKKGLKIFPEIVQNVVRENPNAHFLIVGVIRAPAGADRWLAAEGISANCTYIPWTNSENVHTYLMEASIGLVLSQPQGMHLLVGPGNGRKLFTYLAAGVPVVAPQHSEAWDLVTNRRVGIQVDTSSAEQVATGIRNLLKDKRKRKLMSHRSRKLFFEEFNWNRQEKSLIEFYRGFFGEGECL